MVRVAEQTRRVKNKKIATGYGRWFRFYTEAMHDPKIVTLSDRSFRSWINLLSMAAINDGVIPSTRDVAAHLRMTCRDAEDQINELLLAGLIDIDPHGKLAPHNWSKRQYKTDAQSSTARVQKHRAKQPCNNDETFHETKCNVSASESVSESENFTTSALPCQEEDSEVVVGGCVREQHWPARVRCSGSAGCTGWPCSACVETTEVVR